ncbi:MAG: DUF1858 domain-containing protein [Lysinibacillus sp.]
MTKVININRTIYEVSNQYSEIIMIIGELDFDNIPKPGMLQTAGRVMMLPKGCRMKGISLENVIAALQQNGFSTKE